MFATIWSDWINSGVTANNIEHSVSRVTLDPLKPGGMPGSCGARGMAV